MSPPTIKIFGQVGLNPISPLGETTPEAGDSEITVLYATANLLRTLGDMFERQAAQLERDFDELGGLG